MDNSGQFGVSTFQEELSFCLDEITNVISHINELLLIKNLPDEIRDDLEEKGIKSASILTLYARCLESEDDEIFDKLGMEIIKNIEENMLFMHHLMGEINYYIKDYGEGPKFSKDHILCEEPHIEI